MAHPPASRCVYDPKRNNSRRSFEPSSECSFHDGSELFHLERLAEPYRVSGQAIGLWNVNVSCRNNDGQVWVFRADCLRQIDPGHSWHRVVDNDQINRLAIT